MRKLIALAPLTFVLAVGTAFAESANAQSNRNYDRTKTPTMSNCDAACEARQNQPLVPRGNIPSPAEQNPNFDRPIGDPCTAARPCP
jgi:hypothetical protein